MASGSLRFFLRFLFLPGFATVMTRTGVLPLTAFLGRFLVLLRGFFGVRAFGE